MFTFSAAVDGNKDSPKCSVCVCCVACAAHCSLCDAADRGAGKCNDGCCDPGYAIDTSNKICVPGKCRLLPKFHILHYTSVAID